MKVTDLTERYIEHVPGGNNLSAYRSSYPALFSHYFEFFGNEQRWAPRLDADQTRRKLQLVKGRLPAMEQAFSRFGLEVRDQRLVLFVGQGTSNGHAFRDGEEFVVWIPVETYATPSDVDVFVTHEIAHALHYTRSPGFYFDTLTDQRRMSRQLVTEGIATYLTVKVMGVSEEEALWADYLSPQGIETWMETCRRQWDQLKRFTLDNFEDSDEAAAFFWAIPENDVFGNRGGYYVGLKIVEEIADRKKLTPIDLLGLPKDEILALTREALRS